MPLVQIAVDIAAPTGASERDRGGCEIVGPSGRRPGRCSVLLEACTAAASPAACILAEDTDLDAAVTVLVLWRGRRHARIQVVSGAPSGKRWVRDLDFGPMDVTVEKWRSVGYAVGTLGSEAVASRTEAAGAIPSGGTEGDDEARGPTTEPMPRSGNPPSNGAGSPDESSGTKPVPRKEAPSPTASSAAVTSGSSSSGPTRHQYRWSVEAGASMGPGAPVRIGGFARASRAFEGPFITAALGYSIRIEDERGVTVRWITPSVGAGWEIPATPWLSCHLSGEIITEQLVVEVVDRPSARRDTQSRWIGGIRVGAELATPGVVGVLAGAEATLRGSQTDIQLGNDPAGTIPMADYSFLMGMRTEWR